MSAQRPPAIPAEIPSVLVSVTRPAPGYRLAFVSIPRLLETCLRPSLGETFRTAPPQAFTEDDFRESFLGSEELAVVNRFKALKKQVEWMAGRYAAKKLARRFLDGRPQPADTPVAYRAKGAPYLVDAPDLPISISHSWGFAVAGLGLRPSCTLGLDLECIRPGSRQAVLRTAFSDREAAALDGADDTTLFLRWTAKEAYLKYIGMGFHESLKQVEILEDAIWHHNRPVPFLALHSHLPFAGYAFSLVCGSRHRTAKNSPQRHRTALRRPS